MKRRKFLRIAALTPVAAAMLSPIDLAKAQIPPGRPPQGAPQGGFPPRNQGPSEYVPTGPGIKVRFMGTGSADWRGQPINGEYRRNASILVDGKVIFDLTKTAVDMIPADCHPEVIFYTHSHNDHYVPEAALEVGIKRVYLGETWIDRAKEDFRKASEQTGKPVPEFIPLKEGQTVTVEGLTVTALPANHASNYNEEQTLIYLIEKDSARLLYATDTGGLTARALGFASVGQFSRNRKFLTGIIMEATMDANYAPDQRLFSHSSVDLVATTVQVLSAGRQYMPAEGQKVYITHLGRTYPPQAQIDSTLPAPLSAAYDGLEVLFP